MALEPRDASLNEPFRDRPGRDEPSFAATAVRPMVWGAAVLMAAAAVVYLLPADLWSRFWAPAVVDVPSATPIATPSATSIARPVVIAPLAQDTAASAADAQTAAASAAVDAAVAAVPAPILPLTPTTVGGADLSTPPATAAPTLSAAPAMPGLVQLRTTQASWIEARDARGAMLLSRIVQPGESVGLDGNLPIRMTIGNASATQLGFRGQAIDLAPRTRDNIARVELQ